ncbi:MAG: TolC family protein [Halothiobacillaceae bacterium]|nr:MAG: TolC family protein [Halothiobacillaceae bacterium]
MCLTARMNRYALLLVLSMTAPASLLAGAPSSPGISLHQALEQLLSQSPEQALIEARKAEADAIQRQADGLLAAPPALNLAAQGGREQGSFGEYREWSAGIELPLWRPGQSAAHQQLSRSIEGLAREDFHLLRWDLAGQLREAAWRVELAHVALITLEQTKAEADKAHARLARLVALGERPRADLLTLDGELLDLEQQADAARGELSLAQQAWRLISRQEALPAAPKEALAAAQPIEAHPQLAQAGKALERAQAERRSGVLAAAGSPKVGLAARHEQPPGGPSLDALTISLNLPLGSERHRAAAEAPLRYAETGASVQMAQTARLIQLQRQEAEHGLASARRQSELAQRRAATTREALRLAGRRLDEGEMDTVDYVTVMRRSHDAERAAQISVLEIDHWIARSNQAQGLLP